MDYPWEIPTRYLLNKLPSIPQSHLYRTLIAIGVFYTSTLAFRLLSFAQIYLLGSARALNRFTSPRSTPSWALITGSSDGIGKGFASELCSRGLNIVLHGRNLHKLETVREELLKQWPTRDVRILVLDASTDASDERKLDEAARSLEDVELRILVNNVGGNGSVAPLWAPLAARSSSDVGQFIDINARFATEITRVLLPLLTKHGKPSLMLNVGSAISDYAVPYLAMYSGGKAYLATLSKSLRMEMKAEGHDVDVLHLQVGMVATERETDRIPSFMTPSPRGFAKSALDVVGCGSDEVWPWWQHAIQFGLIDMMPGWIRERIFMGIIEKERAINKRET